MVPLSLLVVGGAVAVSSTVVRAQGYDDPVVVTIGDRQVHASVIRRALVGVPAFELKALGGTKSDILHRYVDEAIVNQELLAIGAEKKGALDDRAVRLQLQKALAGALVRRELSALGSRDSISIDEVKAYYAAHIAEYVVPERVRIAHIVVADQAKADQVLAAALADPTREGWSKIVAENSLDPNSKMSAGDLGFVSADGRTTEPRVVVPLELVKPAFALKDGEIAPQTIHSSAGFHVLFRRGHQPATTRTMEMESQTIREVLFEQKQQGAYKALVDRLTGAAAIEIDEELLPLPSINVGPRPIPKQPGK